MGNFKILSVIILMFILAISCKKEKSKEAAEYNFDSIVDSTFYCQVFINGDKHLFEHYITNSFSTNTFKDSILYNFGFHFTDSLGDDVEQFEIVISKMSICKEAGHTVENEGNCYRLSSKEFLSIFQETSGNLMLYDTSYDYSNSLPISGGIGMGYDDKHDRNWRTSALTYFFCHDRLLNVCSDASFSINNIEKLNDSQLIIEGSFDLRMYNEVIGELCNFSDGYFKVFANNIFD